MKKFTVAIPDKLLSDAKTAASKSGQSLSAVIRLLLTGFVSNTSTKLSGKPDQLAELAVAYSNGLVTWHQIAEQTGASYGELLIALGQQNLDLPQVTPKRRLAQTKLFNRILKKAAKKSKGPK